MANTELLMRLRELHEELASINEKLAADEEVDEATVDQLGQFVTEIGDLVDRAEAKDDAAPPLNEEHQNLNDRITQFESDHPQVTNFLGRLADMLGMMGI
jgi:chromosome segregation ATPase